MSKPQPVETAAPVTRSERAYAWERSARLWSGLVLFVFVLTHLLNHAMGILGVEAMEHVQVWRSFLWRTWPGTFALYGAAAIHISLALKRIVTRRTWRMPLQEALQIALGLAIPILLLEHALGTRYVASFAGVDDSYANVLRILWPAKATGQILLLVVVWLHAVIGIHYVLRARPWFPRWRETLVVLAVLIPVLAIAGFIAGGREAMMIDRASAGWTAAQVKTGQAALRFANMSLLLAATAVVGTILLLAFLRRIGRNVAVRYVGHGIVRLPRGSTLLEASRSHAIPHPSLCGGRARCSTCRVLVTEGLESLPEPGPAEAAMLKRISAPPRVRLACQVRPTQPLAVQVLLPVAVSEGNIDWSEEGYKWGTSRTATVLIVDLRAFSRLAETQLPYDLVLMLNRFIGEMRQSIEAHGGRVSSVEGDGVLALFGLSGERGFGSRGAMAAARDMLRAVTTLNRELHAALSMPLRIGIGIHTGPVVLGRVGDEVRGYQMSALGETVSIASRLEQATKEALADCIVSSETLAAAGRTATAASRKLEIHVATRPDPVIAHALEISATPDEVGAVAQ
ncbi:MAG: adenylate/guanylate cyclase domain-containing protein [Hyphomicrobiaceae bacterium]